MPSIGPYQAGKVLGGADARPASALMVLGQGIARHMRDVLAEHNLKPRQLRILDLLSDRGPIGQRELAAVMGIDHSTLVTLLNPLEAEQLVKRERDTLDRRRHVVTITAAGERRLIEADEAFRDAENVLLSPLDAGERDQLQALLARLRQAADEPGHC